MAQCVGSYAFSMLGHQHVRHMPTFVALEPANYCMLHCPQCPVGMRGNESRQDTSRSVMSLELCRDVIDQVASTAHTVIFHFQGEPLLNPALPEMVRYAHEKRLFTMLSTNAQTLTKELAQALSEAGLDRIIISMDGITQESYAHYRCGGNLDRVKAGLRYLSAIPRRLRPEIVLQCLYLKSNEHEWEELKRSYKALGADRLEMKTAQFYQYENGHPDMPSDERYSRYYRGLDGRYHIKNPLRNRCYRLWSGCVITAEGEMLPCCQAKNRAFSYGNVRDVSFRQTWQSQQAVAFRDRVLRDRASVEMCGNCPE